MIQYEIFPNCKVGEQDIVCKVCNRYLVRGIFYNKGLKKIECLCGYVIKVND